MGGLPNVYDAGGTLVHIDNVTDGKKTDYIKAGSLSIARIENNVPTYLHNDHLGSAQTGTNSAGNVIWREKYTPYGSSMNNPAANNDQAGFTGHIKDSATGLNYMQARYYDPLIGRFLSIDPVGFSPDMPFMFGRYTYVGNDPVNFTDPTGRCRSDACRDARSQAIGQIVDEASEAIQDATEPGSALHEGARAAEKVGEALSERGGSKKGAKGGPRAGKKHTRAAINKAKESNAAENGGKVKCSQCGRDTTPTTRRTAGSKVNPREGQGDHIIPRSKGGDGATVKDQKNIDIKCSECNLRKSDKLPE